jgi:lipoprotein-anchoring transpeptidase ErfK/SrfK
VRLRLLISLAALVAVIVLAGGGLLVYANSRADTIAKGVRIGGVDVGGLTKARAETRLQRVLVGALRRTIVVNHGKQNFTLTVKRAGVRVNIDASVAAALARSRQGSAFSRGLRDITGGTVRANIVPAVTFDHHGVVNFLDRVRKSLNRAPINAKVSISADGLKRVKARVGLKLRTHRLHQLILAAITDPTVRPRFVATTIHTQPKVRTAATEKQFATALIVNRSKFTLTLYKHFKLVKRYVVSIGVQGLETPAGLYHIQNKAVNPGWQVPNSPWAGSLAGTFVPPGPADPIKARWLGIIDGAGIHGVDPSEYGSIGHAGSHGCVRMRIPDVIDLYPRVPVGTPILIA